MIDYDKLYQSVADEYTDGDVDALLAMDDARELLGDDYTVETMIDAIASHTEDILK